MIDLEAMISVLYSRHRGATARLEIYVNEMLKFAETSFADQIKGKSVGDVAPEFIGLIESAFLEMKKKLPGTLLEMAFIYRVALYDAFVPDLVRVVLVNRPMLLKSKKIITHQEIIEQSNLESLIELMAENEVEGLTRGSLKDQRKWLKDHLHIDTYPSADLGDEMQELVARRNVFVHANGIVNQSYLSLVAGSPRKIGERLFIDEEYWEWLTNVLRTSERELKQKVLEKQS